VNTRSLESVIERIVKAESADDKRGSAISTRGDSRDKELFQKMIDSELNKIEKFYLRQVLLEIMTFHSLEGKATSCDIHERVLPL
jgi:hypothetical protein